MHGRGGHRGEHYCTRDSCFNSFLTPLPFITQHKNNAERTGVWVKKKYGNLLEKNITLNDHWNVLVPSEWP